MEDIKLAPIAKQILDGIDPAVPNDNEVPDLVPVKEEKEENNHLIAEWNLEEFGGQGIALTCDKEIRLTGSWSDEERKAAIHYFNPPKPFIAPDRTGPYLFGTKEAEEYDRIRKEYGPKANFMVPLVPTSKELSSEQKEYFERLGEASKIIMKEMKPTSSDPVSVKPSRVEAPVPQENQWTKFAQDRERKEHYDYYKAEGFSDDVAEYMAQAEMESSVPEADTKSAKDLTAPLDDSDDEEIPGLIDNSDLIEEHNKTKKEMMKILEKPASRQEWIAKHTTMVEDEISDEQWEEQMNDLTTRVKKLGERGREMLEGDLRPVDFNPPHKIMMTGTPQFNSINDLGSLSKPMAPIADFTSFTKATYATMGPEVTREQVEEEFYRSPSEFFVKTMDKLIKDGFLNISVPPAEFRPTMEAVAKRMEKDVRRYCPKAKPQEHPSGW